MFDLNSLKSLKSFDWRSLQKLANPQLAGDLNAFLEKMPQNVGQTMLIIAGITWAAAGAIGLYTVVELKKLGEVRASLQEANAVKPAVPLIRDVAVDPKEVKAFVDKMKNTYRGVSISSNGSTIVILADSTAAFGQFREAIGHVQNGGSGWRVNMDRMCVGRECSKNPLAASLKISKVSVDKPG